MRLWSSCFITAALILGAIRAYIDGPWVAAPPMLALAWLILDRVDKDLK